MIKRIIMAAQTSSFQTLSIFASCNLVVAIIGGLGGVIQSRWASPEVFGEFRKYGILTGYLTIGVAFVHDALTRQYPYLIGKGNKDAALRVVAAAKWWYVSVSVLFSLVYASLSCVAFVQNDLRATAGWALQIICVWSTIYGLYLGVMYRTSLDFRRLSFNSISGTMAGFVSLVFVKFYGYWGLLFRNALQLGVGIWLNQKYVPVRVKSAFDRGQLLELSKMSLPLSLPGYISTSLTTASLSVVVLTCLGQANLGIYGVSLSLQSMAMTVTTSLGQMFYPKIMHKYGETESFAACIRYALKPTILNVVLSTAIVAVLYIVIDPFVRLIIPKYVAAIPIIRILSLSIILTAAALPFIVFVSALRYRTIGCLAVVRFAVCFILIGCLPKTLAIIVWSVVAADVVYVLAGYMLILSHNVTGTARQ